MQNCKSIRIFVHGWGCKSVFREPIKQRNCTIEACDTTLGVISGLPKLVLKLHASKKQKFVQLLASTIKRHLSNKDQTIILVGHSYGGELVSLFAEYLSNIETTDNVFDNETLQIVKERIRIYTLGSTYIPRHDDVKDINIEHMMFVNDVALRINKQAIENPAQLTWLSLPRIEKYTILKRWKIHTEYFNKNAQNIVNTLLFDEDINIDVLSRSAYLTDVMKSRINTNKVDDVYTHFTRKRSTGFRDRKKTYQHTATKMK